MSDTYFYGVGSQTSRFKLGTVKSSTKNDILGWAPRGPSPWSPAIQLELLSFFTKLKYPFRSYTEIPFKEPLRSEIRRFFISLDAYIESPNPVIPYRDILYGAADIKFSKYLKRVKRKSFETTWAVDHFDYPDWWNDVPSYPIKDIGDIFNYSYLIHWQDESDDYLEGFHPVKIEPEWLAKFKNSVKEILPDRESFSKIEPIEVLSTISSSMSIEQGTFKHVPHFKIKDKYLYFSKKRGTCERSVINVSPENVRDTVLNCPSDLNTISLIDKQTMEMLRVMPGHIHLSDKDRVTRRLRRLHKKFRFFLQRDLKKEGITKPRELLKVMLEALSETYPDIEIYRNTSFFDTYILRVNGENMYPKRGHGLGMANSLTTLMQLAVHNLIEDELINDTPDIYSGMLCINDDFTVGFQSIDHCELYWDMEDEVMSHLSLLREPTKSFMSELKFVLAERYFTPEGEYEKTSYQLRELLYPLACYNITHAKEYFISAQAYCKSAYTQRYIGEISSYWGYEFYPTEFNYPYAVGGWINEKINSVDMSLILIESLELKSYVFRGFEAQKIRNYRSKKGLLWKSPIYRLLGEPHIPDEYAEHFDYIPYSSVIEKYGRLLSNSRRYFYNYWNKLYKKRQKVFKKASCNFTYEELLKKIINHFKTTQFYPNDSMVIYYHPCNVIQAKIKEIYLDPNPKLSLLGCYNNLNYPFKERFSIHFTDTDAHTKKTSGLFSKEVQRALKSETVSVLATGKFHEIYYPSDDYSPEEQYLNPVKIGEVTSIINWGLGYPELKPGFEHPLLTEKKEVFNYLFSIPELFEITKRKLTRETLLRVTHYMRTYSMSLHEILSKIDSLYDEEEFRPVPCQQDYDDEAPFMDRDTTRVTSYSGNVKYITLGDLLENQGMYFFLWKDNQKDYVPADQEVADHLSEMSSYLLYATYPGLRTPEQRLQLYERIEPVHGPILKLLIDASGIGNMLKGIEQEEIWDSDEEPFGLFGEG